MEKRCLVAILCVVVASLTGLVIGFVALANALNDGAVKSYSCLDDQCQCTNRVADCNYRDVKYISPVAKTIQVLKLSFTQNSFGRRINLEPGEDLFVNVTGIESLLLVACELRRIPRVPASAIHVDLSHNPLGHLDVDDVLTLSPKTVSLTMSDCQLTYVAPGSFDLLPLLQRLDLSYNYFPQVWKSGVNQPMLQKMDYLDLTKNVYLECDEDAAMLGYYLRSRPYAFVDSEVSSPGALRRLYTCSNRTTGHPVQMSILELPYPKRHQKPRNGDCASSIPEALNVSAANVGNSSCEQGDNSPGAFIYFLVFVVIGLVVVLLVVTLVCLALKKNRRRDIRYMPLSQFS